MRWADEVYVKVYTRDTAEWLALGWEAQSLLLAILRKADRAGIVSLGRTGLRGIAGLTGFPGEVVSRALPVLLDDGCLEQTPDALVVRNFLAAQETPASDRARKQAQRERDRDVARQPKSATVDLPPAPSPPREELAAAEPVKAVPVPVEPPPSAESRTLDLFGAPVVEPVAAPKATSVKREDPADVVYAVYLDARAKAGRKGNTPKIKQKERKLVADRLKEGCTEEQLFAAARGIWINDGRREEGYREFFHAMRDTNIAALGILDEAARKAPVLGSTVAAPPPPRSPSPPPASPRAFAAPPARACAPPPSSSTESA
jgi:hypothetical protein